MRKVTADRNKQVIASYNNLIAAGTTIISAVDKISKDYDIGKFYVRQILKESGVDVRVRVNGQEDKSKRKARIFELFMKNVDIADIADDVGITPTRVGQIVRSGLGKHAKDTVLEKTLDLIKKDVKAGMSHKDISDKYGSSVVRKVKVNLGYNIFEACIKERNSKIFNMHGQGMIASEIAEKCGLTRDHVYSILSENGKRRRPTRAEYNKRNKNIIKLFSAGRSSQDIADKYSMTVTNVNIILKNNGVRDGV